MASESFGDLGGSGEIFTESYLAYLSTPKKGVNESSPLNSSSDSISKRKPISIRVQNAALHILDGIEGRVRERPYDSEEARMAFRIHLWLLIPVRLATLLIVLLTFVERPVWSYHIANFTSHPEWYPRFGLPIIPRWSATLTETICLLLLVINVLLQLWAQGRTQYFESVPQTAFCGVLAVASLDLLVDLFTEIGSFRLAVYVRIALLVMQSNAMLMQLRCIRSTVRSLLGVWLTFALFITFATWTAKMLVVDSVGGGIDEYGVTKTFPDVTETTWKLFVMITTCNYPDVMMPAYQTSRFTFFFFGAVLIFGNWFLLNLILAIVNAAYTTQKAQEEEALQELRRSSLEKAFDLMDEDGDGIISREEIEQACCEPLMTSECQGLPMIAHECQ